MRSLAPIYTSIYKRICHVCPTVWHFPHSPEFLKSFNDPRSTHLCKRALVCVCVCACVCVRARVCAFAWSCVFLFTIL